MGYFFGDGYVNYGPDWIEIAESIRRRDNHICQVCGLHRKGNTNIKALDVHHVKPLRDFNGDYRIANKLENLVTLCESCHTKVEAGIIPLHFEHRPKNIYS